MSLLAANLYGFSLLFYLIRIDGLDIVAPTRNATAENGTLLSLQCAAISNGTIGAVRWLMGVNHATGSNVTVTDMNNEEIAKLIPDGYGPTKEMKGSRLNFSPLLLGNDGVWTCMIGSDTRDVYVTVLTPPRAPSLTADSTDWIEGMSVKFTCSSGDGNPFSSLSIDWLYSGLVMFDSNSPTVPSATRTETPQVEKYGGFKSELTLNLSRSMFGAIVSCRVRHRDPPAGKSWSFEAQGLLLKFKYGPYLKIKASSPTKTVDLPVSPLNEVKVVERSNVSFVCSIDAYPEPSDPDFVSWSTANASAPRTALEFFDVTRESSKTYSCVIRDKVPLVETKVFLNVLYGPTLKFPPNMSDAVIRIAEGSNLNFSFVVEANPFPNRDGFHWSKNGKDFGRGRYLNLSRLERYASGNYSCEAITRIVPFDAGDGGGGVVSSQSMIKLIVNYPPGMADIASNKANVYKGGEFVLTCRVYGSDANSDMSVVWLKDDVALNATSTDAAWMTNTRSAHAPPDTVVYSATLRVTNASKLDRGAYRCSGTNAAGTGQKSNTAEVDVYDVPTLVSFSPALSLLEPSEGETLPALQCVVYGRPKPTIKWLKNNNDVDDDLYNSTTVDAPNTNDESAYVVSSTFVAKRALRASDAGNYSCLTTLEGGDSITMKSILVAVKQMPIFTDPQLNVTADLNGTAYLRCQCYAYPIPELSWYKDGLEFRPGPRPVPDTGRRRVNQTESNWLLVHASLISIEGVLESDAGQYVCLAANAIGTTNRSTILIVKTPPKTPEVISPVTTTWESIGLNWNPGSNGGYPQAFRIYYYVKGGNYSAINPAQLGTGIDGVINVTDGTSLNITGLLPGKTYIVRVIGFNLLGESRASQHEVNTTTFEVPPMENVVYVIRNTAVYFTKIQFDAEPLCVFLRPNDSTSLNYTCRPIGDGQYEYSVKIDAASYVWLSSFCLQRRGDVCGPTSVVDVDSRLLGTESAIALGVLCPLLFIALITGIGIVIHLCTRNKMETEKERLSPVQAKNTSLPQTHVRKVKVDSGSTTSDRDSDKQNETLNSSSSDLKSVSGRGSQNFRNKMYINASMVDLSDAGGSESGQETTADRGKKIYHEVVV